MIKRTLGSLLDLKDSGVWGDEDAELGVSILRSTNFQDDGTLNLQKLTHRKLEQRDAVRKLLAAGDILLEKSGGGPKQPVGRVCFFEGDSQSHTFSNFIARLRATNEVAPKYLFYFLRQFHAMGKTEGYQKQTTGIRNLEFKRFLDIELPLPPLDEQQRIADILDRAASIQRLRQAADEKLKQIIPALFVDMFGDPATNTKKLPLVKLGDLIERIETGKNVTAGSGTSEYSILKVSAVTSGTYKEHESKPAPDDHMVVQSHIVREGDFLFSRANTVDLVGATAIVHQTNGKTLLPDKLWRIRWRKDADPRYMLAVMQNKEIRAELGRASSGTSASMRNISQGRLASIEVPVASFEQQSQFGRISEALTAKAWLSQQASQHAQSAAASLTQSVFGN